MEQAGESSSPDIAALTAELLALDRASGARAAAPAAVRAVRALRAAPPAPAGPWRGRPPGGRERAELAELFEVAAWILFDAEHHAASYRLNRRALALARGLREDGRSIELLTLSVLSMQEAHLGRPGDSLRISSSVLAGADLPPRVAALFHLREARAHAQLKRRSEALRSLRTGRELLSDRPSAQDPSWAWWLDRAEFDGHHGLALADLGDLDGAAALLHGATEAGDGPAYRSLFATELARVLATAGAWREADAWLSSLVESVPGIGSVRALNSLGHAAHLIEHGRGVPRGLRDTTRHLRMLLDRETPHRPR
ncbi:DNA-binding protein [Streptomyces sp. NPDC050856]|uniref:DNA-binding protein n=1 Tax=Streptomyces sp. NPDC050856 TaxID=3154939 RepID=UPI0033EF5AA9